MRLLLIKVIFLSLIFLISCTISTAQSYNTAIGLRFSDMIGINLSQRIGKKSTLQLNHAGGLKGLDRNTTLHYVRHTNLLVRNVNFVSGIGLNGHYNVSANDNPYAYGIRPTGLIGAEISMGQINISIDWMPMIDFSKYANKRFEASTGITVRYIINKRESKFKSWRKKIFKKKKK